MSPRLNLAHLTGAASRRLFPRPAFCYRPAARVWLGLADWGLELETLLSPSHYATVARTIGCFYFYIAT
ncbi:hypothetical protein PoB_002711700 [Plakobranchus ocellatus]|uniref:Uncharacterized protein n=1 Tax=Plakobranchus ocellatus TaxID=259542 RepID=A0AAV4A171_9GAST|nr:hypothetical protein PoB_002711700 [Plakobranchus ocellatus]